MKGGADYDPLSVGDVFSDFKGRRAGLIKALTTDADELFKQCDPEKENLCLYGHPDEQWAISLPPEEVPPEFPEPTVGINFARDQMQQKDWLALVAIHSDMWLYSIACYFGGRFRFNKEDRQDLFDKINDLPTIFEVVTGTAGKQVKSKSKSNSKAVKGKNSKVQDYEDKGLDEKCENDDSFCGKCGECYVEDEFWILCETCDIWFHGQCVNITPERADHIKKYKCPTCSNMRKHTRRRVL